MCKILIIPKVIETETVKKFMRAAVYDFTQSDSDGIGYAALNKNGTLSGEQWLNPKDAFKPAMESASVAELQALTEISHALDSFNVAPSYNAFGVDSKEWASVVYHARYATCEKSLGNVHPFLNETETVALIHNGVISKGPKEWDAKASTCDSEILLNGYIDAEVSKDVRNFDEVNEYVQGYYALGVLAKRDDGQWILDVIKDNKAELQAVYVNELQSIVFCTDAEIIQKTCKLLGWNCGAAYSLNDNVVLRYDAMTGQVIGHHEIECLIDAVALDSKSLKDAQAYRDAEAMGAYESELDGRYSRAMADDDYGFARDYSPRACIDDDEDYSENFSWHDDGMRVNDFIQRGNSGAIKYEALKNYPLRPKKYNFGR